MTDEEKKAKARARAKVWREAYPDRYKAAIEKCKANNPEKYKALQIAWCKANPERKKELGKKWRLQNPQRSNDFSTAWVKSNPELRREASNRWRINNPEKVNAVYARRRAAKKNAVPKWANHFFIAEIYHLAKLRTKMLGYSWHVDHIAPLTSPLVCGLHVEHNLQVIPKKHNQSKNNRYWPEMP